MRSDRTGVLGTNGVDVIAIYIAAGAYAGIILVCSAYLIASAALDRATRSLRRQEARRARQACRHFPELDLSIYQPPQAQERRRAGGQPADLLTELVSNLNERRN